MLTAFHALLAQQATPVAAPSASEEEARKQKALDTAIANDSGRPTAPKEDQPFVLSPFEVTASNKGYQATNTMSGTRLNSKLEDLAASISVVTKQQLDDMAAVDINDIFSTESNTEGIYQYTEFTIDRGFTVDTVSQTPENANRVRGLGQANLANNGFAASRQIPIDTYNIDSVEISRGPNSNLFGIGEPSGTVNLIRGRANLTKDITQTSVRVDDRGSFRSTINLNRVLVKDKLAVRFAAVHDQEEYVRKPSLDRTNRYTAALSIQPFKNTTIRVSYENYSNFGRRPNSTTPRDFVTEWRANGSPVWDPTFSNGTGGWRLLNGSTYTAVTAANEGTQFPRGLAPNFTNFWNRPSLYVEPDGSISRYEVTRASNAVSNGIPLPGNANTNLRYAQIGTLLSRGGAAFGSVATPLFQAPGITDQSIYDWESINFASPNFATKHADILQAEVEQSVLRTERQQLAIQAGVMRERIASDSRAYVGASDGAPPVIQLDVNEKYLDGTPNPNFLRPYIGGSEMQAFRRPEDNEQERVTVAYQLDMTHESNWMKWLGRHNFAGYGEFRQMITAPNGLRYRDQVVSNEAWHSGSALTNLPARGADNRFYTRYYMGDSIANGGSVVDYGGSSPLALSGPQTYHYFNGVTNQWANESVDVAKDVYFALGKQKQQIRTLGLIWQGFLYNDRIIPTLGYRKDRSRSKNNVAVPLRSDGYLDTDYLDVFPKTWTNSQGPTKTQGIVVVPFTGWRWLEERADRSEFWNTVRSLRFHYNQSDSFQPVAAAYNLFAEVLPNPTGDGKDYGFSFNTLNDRISVHFNHYNTKQQNVRNGATAVLGTRPVNLDFDASGDNAVFGTGGGNSFDLEDNVSGWLGALNPAWTPQQLQTETYRIMGLTQERIDGLKNKTLSDINNVTSKGNEIEIYYNSSDRNFTVKANVTQQIAIDTSVSPNVQRYLDERLPYWLSIRVPTGIVPGTGQQLPNAGRLWWEVGAFGATGTNIPMNYYTANIDAPYKLAVTNSGKPRPQTREWRASMTSNLRLAALGGDRKSWWHSMSVGGTVRWEDKSVMGFMGGTPDADGVIRSLDANKPIYDKARFSADLMANYNLKFWRGKVGCRLQLNVRNAFENGRLQPIAYNPDGTPWNFRIVDPRQFILTATFDL